MSLSASRDVARNIGEALEILRRPGHEFGREFLVQTESDIPYEISLLSSDDVLRNGNSMFSEFEFFLPHVDPASPPRGSRRMRSALVYIPLITGKLTCGLCLQMQTQETPVLGMGKISYAAGRYVRCEATGECLMFLRAFGGEAGEKGRTGALVYSRRDSPGGRYQMLAITRLGVTMRQICDDYDRGEPSVLSGNFIVLQKGAQLPVNGCSQCGRVANRGCNCDSLATVPNSSFDFSAVAYNHRQIFGSFRVTPVLFIRDARTEATKNGIAADGTTRCALSTYFSKMVISSPSTVTYKPLDELVSSHVTASCVQDYIQVCGIPRSLPMPRVEKRQRAHYAAQGPYRSLSPVENGLQSESISSALDSSAFQCEFEYSANRLLDTGAPNQQEVDSIQGVEGCHQQHPAAGVAFDTTMPAMEEVIFAGAQETPDSSEELLPQPLLDEIAHNPTDFSAPGDGQSYLLPSHQPADAPYESLPPRNPILHSGAPLALDNPVSQPVQAEIVPDSPPSGIVSGSLQFGSADGSGGESHEILPGSTPHGGSGMKAAPEILTRREKNRRAAARSNERRRRALETLKLEIARAKEELREVVEREADAKKLNMQLKEEATRRWIRNKQLPGGDQQQRSR